ncbi:MAG: hypothetical protein NT167_10060, partial [Verrucomicrobia bacterium]|nr:hypothetical protein [Verrucomicrobiota bacterium]
MRWYATMPMPGEIRNPKVEGGTEVRRPKAEVRKKAEDRNPNSARLPTPYRSTTNISAFGFRISFGLRVSDFGFP